jgi:hypothetical protein
MKADPEGIIVRTEFIRLKDFRLHFCHFHNRVVLRAPHAHRVMNAPSEKNYLITGLLRFLFRNLCGAEKYIIRLRHVCFSDVKKRPSLRLMYMLDCASVVDLGHFGTDPDSDPRIRAFDQWPMGPDPAIFVLDQT